MGMKTGSQRGIREEDVDAETVEVKEEVEGGRWREEGAEESRHPSGVSALWPLQSSTLTSQFLHPFISHIVLHSTVASHSQSHAQSLIITRNCSTYEITESNIPLSDMISFPYGLFAQVCSLKLFYELNE